MTMANVDYWRTIREFDSNASIIADQAQDVVTFRGGQNIYLQFNEGDDIITWNADLPSIISDVTANLAVINSEPLNPSMLEYDPVRATFTYYPPDLSQYATTSYVDSAITNGINNIDLSEYATQEWVRGYVGSAVPDFNNYATISYVDQSINNLGANINEQIDQIERGYTGSQGAPGNSVKIVGSVENYMELLTRPKWTNYLGDLGDGVIMREGTANLEYPGGSGNYITVEPGSLAVVVVLGPPTIWDPTPGRIIGYTGSFGFSGSQGFTGSTGYTGSAIVVGHTVYEQNVAANVWTINHGLGVKYLSVELVNDQDDSLVGTYSYPVVRFVDEDNLTVTWQQPTTGKAVLSAGGGEQGNIGLTGSTGFTGSIGYSGSAGPPLRVVGAVPTFGDLPDPYSGQVNDVYVIEDTGRTAINVQLNPALWNDLGVWTGYNGSQGIQGPLGYTGSQGVGFTGSAGADVIVGHQVYSQTVASDLWTVTHNLGVQYLSVEVVNDNDNSIVGTYSYPTVTFVDDNTLTVAWSQPTTGKIVMSAGGGDTGFNGSTGFDGSVGFTGSKGDTGFTGSTGFDGSRGDTGFDGSKGDTGFTGSTGSQGITGFGGSRGDTGFDGSTGIIGYTGSQGATGFVGSKGDTGFDGSTGFAGSQGDTGPSGTSVTIVGQVADFASLPGTYTGNLGDGYILDDTGNLAVATDLGPPTVWEDVGQIVGYTGSTGFAGSIGFTGSKGDQGLIGFTGSKGDQGIIGFTGSRGATGFTGSKGDTGFTGSKGDIGFTGSRGDTGFNGSKGDTGFTGSASTVAGPTGFTGSKGDTGFTGSKGDQGDVGFTGSASTVQGPIGFSGSQGVPGEAANVGFDGSKGDQGDVGFTGSQGDQGNVGFTGSASTAQGPVGFSGSIGFTGSKGDTGFTGSASTVAGPTGFTGSRGDDGSQGTTGFTGSIGFTGSASTVAGPTGFTGSTSTVAGPTGFNGSKGDTGFTGSKGDTGFTGSAGAENATLATVTSNGSTTSNDISVGGLALSRDVNFSTDIPTPGTAIDLNRTVHALANGTYTLANGFDGQIMYVIPRSGATKNGVSITFSRIRSSNTAGAAFSDFTNVTLQPFNNANNITGSIVMYMYMDGAWNYELVSSQ